MNQPQIPAPPPGQQVVQGLVLGDTGYALIGCGLDMSVDGDDFVVSLAMAGGRISPIMGITPVTAKLQELKRIPIAEVIALLQAAASPVPKVGASS